MQALRAQDRGQGVSFFHQRQPETGTVQSGEFINVTEQNKQLQLKGQMTNAEVCIGCGLQT